MSATAFKGPLVVYGGRPPLGNQNENVDAGPSLFYGGIGLLDGRAGYNISSRGAIGWFGTGIITTVDSVPSAISATNIAAAQVPVAGQPLVLTGGVGVAPIASAMIVYGAGISIPAGTLAIDGSPGLVGIGMALPDTGNSRFRYYDPTKFIARNIRITSVGNDSGAQFLVSGADVYGYPMTQLVTGANASVAATLKTFDFIYSIVPQGALSGANVSVGTGDVYGLPLRADSPFYVTALWNGAVLAPTVFTAADRTSPATSLTGDPRGTLAVPTASDGMKRLQVQQTPTLAQVSGASLNAGLTGVVPA